MIYKDSLRYKNKSLPFYTDRYENTCKTLTTSYVTVDIVRVALIWYFAQIKWSLKKCLLVIFHT